jgi:hypothetical protein
MMKWKSSFKIMLLALLINSVFACKTKQKTTAFNQTTMDKCEVKRDSVPEIFPIIQQNEANFHEFYKIQSEFTFQSENEDVSLNLQIRLVKNEKLWMSFKKAGITVAKILITPDSLMLLDVIHKKFLHTEIKNIANFIGAELDFKSIQSMLLSSMPLLKDQKFFWKQDVNYVVSNIENKDWDKNNTVDSSKALKHAHWINCNKLFLTHARFVQTSKNQEIDINYEQPDSTMGYWMNKKINFKIFNQNTEKIKGQIVYKDIDIKKDINLPFSIPKDYERMD